MYVLAGDGGQGSSPGAEKSIVYTLPTQKHIIYNRYGQLGAPVVSNPVTSNNLPASGASTVLIIATAGAIVLADVATNNLSRFGPPNASPATVGTENGSSRKIRRFLR